MRYFIKVFVLMITISFLSEPMSADDSKKDYGKLIKLSVTLAKNEFTNKASWGFWPRDISDPIIDEMRLRNFGHYNIDEVKLAIKFISFFLKEFKPIKNLPAIQAATNKITILI